MPTMTKTTLYLNLLRDAAKGAASPVITYIALGTGTSTPTEAQTSLDAEVFRKKVSSYTNGGNGEVFITGYIGPNDAVGVNIQEVAVYGGNATSALNSGTMLGRALYAYGSKTALASINVQLDETFS